MTQQGKVWGKTNTVVQNRCFEMHYIEYNSQSWCSKHKHEHKWNGFLVLEGVLAVKVWQPSGLVDETVLTHGQYTEVPPGVYHQFEGIVGGQAIEVYWAAYDENDIVRETVGGKAEKNDE